MRIANGVILTLVLFFGEVFRVQGLCFFEHECDNGETCYSDSEKCDGKRKCKDGADEKDCGNQKPKPKRVSCRFYENECKDGGGCYNFLQKCDNKKDCADGSDELDCKHDLYSSARTTRSITRTTRPLAAPDSYVTPDYTVIVPGTKVHGYAKPNETLETLCTMRGWKKMVWYKPGEMMDDNKNMNGRLILQRITCEDAGTYVCYPDTKERDLYGIFELHVDGCSEKTTQSFFSNENYPSSTAVSFVSKETFGTPAPCKNFTSNDCCCVCNKQNCMTTPALPIDGVQCQDGSWISRRYLCNGVRDCQDGSDELNCISYPSCAGSEYRCRSGGCIPYFKYCDGKSDCPDSSDESNCSGGFAPKIIQLPHRTVDVDCMDHDKRTSGSHMLELECTFVGNPTPQIKWKKYEGQVPSKCQQSSYEGHGVLKCPDFQQSDQGAYSCVAENSKGSSESQPKSVVKCNRITCDSGFTVIDEHKIESCLECFCSGTGSKCSGIKSKGSTYTYDFPTKKVDLGVNRLGEVSFNLPSRKENFNENMSRVKYCYLSQDDLLSAPFIYSYGKNLKVPVLHNKVSHFVPEAPDVIIKGSNNKILKYSFNKISHTSPSIDLRFWKGSWNLNDNRGASRSDVMRVLAEVDTIFIRCEYQKDVDVYVNQTTKIVLESSEISSFSNSVSYVEKCECPAGYDGLSCQKCASGYQKVENEDGVKCEQKRIQFLTCEEGYIGPNCEECDVKNLYYMTKEKTCVKSHCNMVGSVGIFPDSNDNCICKETVEGKNCDRCKNGSFHLDETNKDGCTKCWCNNLNTTCESSGYFISSISSQPDGGYNSSNGGNFWLLPSEFNGNRLTSYGGFLEYSLTYLANTAKQTKVLSVEILSDKDNSIQYFHTELDFNLSGTSKIWKVPMEEKFWKNRAGQFVTRGEFLTVLSKVKAIYVESPYHLSSGVININWVKLDSAEDMNNDISPFFTQPQTADKVEKCFCPPGYIGLSCESCAGGYYKMKTGEDSFICAECPCDFCDPERGCMDCGKGEYRDNPKSDGPPVCLKCPCNDNEEACMKDEYNMVLCSCKMGYSGINCENELAQRTHLGIKMTPTNVISKEAGSLVIFNCSYNSTETMTIEFERKYGNQQKDSNQKLSHIPGLFRVLTYGKHSSAEIAIDEDLVSVDCVLRDSQSTERARTSALIMGTVTNLVIPQIKNCYNEPKYVNVNEDLELICEASGSPVPDAKWYIIENENYKYVDTVEGVHVVTKAQLDQNGTIYMCIARNSIGDDKCSTHIIVKERCLMTVSPPYLEVEEGEDVQFDCATVNRKSVMWKKQGGFLSYRANDSNGELTIKNVSISDAGQYECSLVDPSEPVTKTATLVVHLKKIPPTAVIKQGDSTLRPGDTLRINCIVSGQPKPNVTWSKIGEIFLPTNVEVDERDHSITIKDANKINNGIYECTAESAIGKSTSRIHLKVSALPRIRIEPKSVTANVGEMVVVNCLVVEGESVNTTWSRISDSPFEKNIATGKELRFQSISSSDAGKFECKATNPYGHAVEVVEVMVRQLPSVKINPDGPLSAFVGEIHDFYCNVTGSPTPRISWTLSGKQGTKPLPGTGNSVRVVVTEDMGKVTCLAENEAGTGTKSVDIIIKDEGKGSSAKYKRAPIGSRVEMIFDELNDPFNCTRSQSSLIGDECYIKNGLEIQSVQVQHNGTYICKTASGQEMSYFLQVVGFVNKFSRLNGSYIILPITLKSTKTLSVEVTFKTESTRGLILMKRKHCDFVMYLLNGRLVVKLNQIDSTNGRRKVSKVIHLKSTKLLKINVWYTVVLELRDSVELYIHDEHGTIVDSQYMTLIPNMTWTTNNEGDFFIGGGTGEKRLPLPPKDAYFDGCISRLIVDGHEYKITEEAKYSRNVTLCNVCSDNIDPCGDEGVCLDAPTQYGYICVCGKNANYCPESCMGIGCRSSHDMCSLLKPCHQQESKCVSLTSSLQCQCPAGFEGHTCETELLYEFSFDGNGYAKLPHRYLPRHSIKNPEVITIEFTQGSDTGLLLFQGDRNNFLLMFVDNDDFTYVYKNQEVVLELTADIKTMSKNSVTIRRMNNTVEISVGDSLFEEKKSEFRTNRVHGDIFIGGISPTTDFPIKYNSEGFKGCIHSLVFGSDDERVNIMANDITRHKLGKTCEAQVARRYDTYEDDD